MSHFKYEIMKKKLYAIAFICSGIFLGACSDFVEIDPPRTDLVSERVFATQETAEAAVIDLYYQMSYITGFASGGPSSISFAAALSADEATNRLTFLPDVQAFYDNAILPANGWALSLWSELYNCIYKTNAILEGLEGSNNIIMEKKQQLEGEAKFVRAFCYFYLINLFNDPPLTLVTDYKSNQNIGRTSADVVYDQIEEDLKQAQSLLQSGYASHGDERTRPNKDAATALLARVSLYRNDWESAQAYATELINNKETFGLTALDEVFLKNSMEAIWQLFPLEGNVYDRSTARSYSRLQPSLIGAFESGDARATTWILQGPRVANKYRSGDNSGSEYSMVIRLAELYLIRAEARAQLGDVAGAQADINAIRARSGLGNNSAADKQSLLIAVASERRLELFMEWGHRWFDLKRYGQADDILSVLKPEWQPTDKLYPIPQNQINNDLSMRDSQNPGY